MLTIHHLYKTYGIQPVLQDISFSISDRERIGLIGPNGCGKTTLLRILSKQEVPDSGTVASTRPGLRIGYLAQGMEFTPDATLQSALNPFDYTQGRPTHVKEADIEAEIASLAAALSADPKDAGLQAQYDHALAQLSSFNFPLASVLAPLGLADIPLNTPIAHLSGGQKTRLMLACVLRQEPHLLLLDEPTNHLDIQMLEWLEDWLTSFKGAALIVSHDRTFLDHTITSILELDPKTHNLRAYPGDYSEYIEQKLLEHEKQSQAYQDQQDEIAQLRAAARHIRGLTKMKKGGKADGGDKKAKAFFGNRATKNVAKRAKNIEARIERILREEKIEKPRASYQIKLDFGAPAHQSKDVMVTEALSIGYTQERPILDRLNLYIRAGQHVALIGPNGSGKTTLIKTIMGKLQPLNGMCKLGQTVKAGYMEQEQELLNPSLGALQIIQHVSCMSDIKARNFLHHFLFSCDDPLRPTRELSFGERARLQLAMLVAQGCTFIILDEPINHLDIPSRARFEQALSNFKGTILAVVHDRYFIESFATHVWAIKDNNIQLL
jgi:ATP-binding cassette subfamily F protein 3